MSRQLSKDSNILRMEEKIEAPVFLQDMGVKKIDISEIADNIMSPGEPSGGLRKLCRKDMGTI